MRSTRSTVSRALLARLERFLDDPELVASMRPREQLPSVIPVHAGDGAGGGHARGRRRSRRSRRSSCGPPGSARGARTTPSTQVPDGSFGHRWHGLPRHGHRPRRAAAARPTCSPTWAARARCGSAWRRSPTSPTCSRTWATARTRHSGYMAIRAAIAADVDMTFKVLLNGYISMTGGQAIPGGLPAQDDGRPGAGRGRQAGRRRHRRHVDVRRRAGVPGRRRRPRPGAADRDPGGAARGPRRHRADLRPGLRGRAAPRAQAGHGRRPGQAGVHPPDGLRGLRRLQRAVQLHLRRAAGDRVRAQAADQPVVVQQGLHVRRRATARASSRSTGRRRAARAGPARPRRRAGRPVRRAARSRRSPTRPSSPTTSSSAASAAAAC